MSNLEERYIPTWVVQTAVAKALGVEVEELQGIEPRGDGYYAVLVECENND